MHRAPSHGRPVRTGGQADLLRVVAVSIVIAVLGVLYIIANPHDGGVKAFGWALVILGSVIAAVVTALWARSEIGTAGKAKSGAGGARRRRGRGS